MAQQVKILEKDFSKDDVVASEGVENEIIAVDVPEEDVFEAEIARDEVHGLEMSDKDIVVDELCSRENQAMEVSTIIPPRGPGIILTNKTGKIASFFFYDNYWNGNGTAGANFDRPLKSVKLGPNDTAYVPLPLTFKGRVQRGTQLPATWAEFQIKASNDGAAHGDISLQQGCDGAATIASTDGRKVSNGFVKDILKDAPAAAIRHKPNGEKALASTEGNWLGPGNKVAADHIYRMLGHGKVYVLGGTGVPDVASHNNCLAVTFY